MLTPPPRDILGIIPARGGSKGIPGKNLRLLGGHPFIVHSIVQAQDTPAIGRVVVSTDDGEIARVSEGWGAHVVHRPAPLSGDTASSESALLHALDFLWRHEGYRPQLVVFLQATSPLRQRGDIQGAIETFCETDADSLFSAGPLHGFLWHRYAQGDELVSFSYDYRRRPRRQDGAEPLVENGSIYVMRESQLRCTGNRLGGRIAVYRMHPLDSFQLDEPCDVELLNDLYPLRGTPLDIRRPEVKNAPDGSCGMRPPAALPPGHVESPAC